MLHKIDDLIYKLSCQLVVPLCRVICSIVLHDLINAKNLAFKIASGKELEILNSKIVLYCICPSYTFHHLYLSRQAA